jgi:FkbM family methyltransferase
MRPYYSLAGKWGLTQLSTGQPFFVDKSTRDLTPWIIMGGTWETFVDDVLCALVRPGDTFVDVGANVGYYTIKIGGLVGATGRVFSFEANPAVFDFLRENVAINGFDARATLFNAAAGAVAGRVILEFNPVHPGGGAVLTDAETPWSQNQSCEVPVVTLDASLPEDAAVDLIKIDVEGFEPQVFAGMQALLARSPDAAIVTEVAYARWSRFGDPAALVAQCAGDRRMFRIHHDGQLEPFTPASLERDFVSYVLMLPRNAEREGQLARLLQSRLPPAPPSAAEQPPEPPPAATAPRASLLRRLARRLLRGL